MHDLHVHAAVALLGPRQAGKTTMARAIAGTVPSIYLDLEDPADRDKLADPALFLASHADKLVIIDEVQNAIEIKRGLSPKVEAGFHTACDDLRPVRRLVVYGGTERVAMPQGVEAVSLFDLATQITKLSPV